MASVIHVRKMSLHIAKIILVILGYCSVSIVLVFANKYLVGNQNSAVDVSLFVLWVQCVVTVAVVTFLNVGKALWYKDWSKVRISREGLLAVPVLKMNCTFVSMLAFNNLCLRHVDVAFYQVARSLTIIFMVIFSISILKKSVSWRIIASCVVVAGGFFLGVDQEQLLGTLSIKGVLFGVSSSLFVALNGIFIKQALDVVDGDSYKLTYYGNINASILFIPIVYLAGQFGEAYRAMPDWTVAFWVFLFITGILCFLIAWIGGMQINLTSPLTHTIIANSKSILQTILAVLYYQENKSALWWLSILLVVGGAFAYTVIKMREEEIHKQAQLSPKDDLHRVENGTKPLLNGRTGQNTEETVEKKSQNIV